MAQGQPKIDHVRSAPRDGADFQHRFSGTSGRKIRPNIADPKEKMYNCSRAIDWGLVGGSQVKTANPGRVAVDKLMTFIDDGEVQETERRLFGTAKNIFQLETIFRAVFPHALPPILLHLTPSTGRTVRRLRGFD